MTFEKIEYGEVIAVTPLEVVALKGAPGSSPEPAPLLHQEGRVEDLRFAEAQAFGVE